MKMKKKKNDDGNDDDDDDDESDGDRQQAKGTADPEESMDEDEDEEESSSDDDDDDEEEEEFTPAKQTTRKRKASFEDGGNTAPKPAQKQKQAAIKAKKGLAPTKKKAAPPKKSTRRVSIGGGGGGGDGYGVGVSGTATQKTIKGALQRMANALLKLPDETPETSLFAALLASHTPSKASNKKKSSHRRSQENDDDDSNSQSMYTPQLQDIARRVILLHHEDPNKAQVDLFNILVRAVGGSVESILDPDEIELGHLEEADLDTFTDSLLDDMRDRPLDEILFSADPLGAAHAEGVKRSAAAATIAPREFRKIFEEFWYLIALSTSAPTVASSKSKTSSSSKSRGRRAKQGNKVSDDGSSMEEDSADDNDDDDSANITPSSNARKQVEMIKEIANHMVEMSAFPIADLRAGTTIAIYRLFAAMLEKTVELNSQIAVSKRQLAIAKKNNMTAKAKALRGQLETWTQTKEALESFVTETGLGVFIQRYMDSNAFIRADSINALCQFTLIRPDLFMASKFTKYFGYTLCDKDAVVRRSAVHGIIATFTACKDDEQYEALMAKFAEKFVPERLADMTHDPDTSVQEGTMKILNLLLDRGLMDGIEDETIWNKINLRALDPSASHALRRDALRFVLQQLEAFDKSSKRDTEANAVTQIKAVVQWYVSHK
jgi:cohesin complex subunit SA-1/2